MCHFSARSEALYTVALHTIRFSSLGGKAGASGKDAMTAGAGGDCGGLAQLGERVNGIHEVRGSSPLSSIPTTATASCRAHFDNDVVPWRWMECGRPCLSKPSRTSMTCSGKKPAARLSSTTPSRVVVPVPEVPGRAGAGQGDQSATGREAVQLHPRQVLSLRIMGGPQGQGWQAHAQYNLREIIDYIGELPASRNSPPSTS